jgi:hypothetical protein
LDLGLAVRRRTVQLGFQLRLVDLDVQVVEGAVRFALVGVVLVVGVVVSLPLRRRLIERLLWLLEIRLSAGVARKCRRLVRVLLVFIFARDGRLRFIDVRHVPKLVTVGIFLKGAIFTSGPRRSRR